MKNRIPVVVCAVLAILSATVATMAGTDIYLGLDPNTLQYVSYDNLTGYSLGGSVTLQAYTSQITSIAVDSSGGVIYTGNSDPCSMQFVEWSYDGSAFGLTRWVGWATGDIALSPVDDKVYAWENNHGWMARMIPSGSTFSYVTNSYGGPGTGHLAVGADGWIIVEDDIYDPCTDVFDWLATYTYDDACNVFVAQQSNVSHFGSVSGLTMSPLDNTITMGWDNPVHGGKYISQYSYAYHSTSSITTVAQDTLGSADPITDLEVLSNGLIITTTDKGSGNGDIWAYIPKPHTIAAGDGTIKAIGIEDIGACHLLDIDDGDTIHVLGDNGYLQAWRCIKVSDAYAYFTPGHVLNVGTGSAITTFGPIPRGDVYDVYFDFSITNNPSGTWSYLDAMGVALVEEGLAEMCGTNPAWHRPMSLEPPWLNDKHCLGGQFPEVLHYGPLILRWTAPEDAEIEIRGYLWQVNNQDYNSVDVRLAYTIDHNGVEIASGAVQHDGSGTLPDRGNRVDFEDGGATVITRQVQAGDTIDLLIDGSGEGGNGECYYGYTAFEITIRKCMFNLLGDINVDCEVDYFDLKEMADNWLGSEPDLDGDSDVDFIDYAYLAINWLIDCEQCPPINPACDPNF